MGQMKSDWFRNLEAADAPGIEVEYVAPATGIRHNEGKIRPTLLSPHAINGLLGVLEFGARKYSARNWEKGLPGGQEAILDSLLRHVLAIMRGEEVDSESGLPHIDHIQCNAMFASHFHHIRSKK